jgi:hypothetical protein
MFLESSIVVCLVAMRCTWTSTHFSPHDAQLGRKYTYTY